MRAATFEKLDGGKRCKHKRRSKMIRPARLEDLPRNAQIEVFNYRLQFYPIFRTEFYFG